MQTETDGRQMSAETKIVSELLCGEIADLEARVKVLEEALRHYADEENWSDISDSGVPDLTYFVYEHPSGCVPGYTIAQAALDEVKHDN